MPKKADVFSPEFNVAIDTASAIVRQLMTMYLGHEICVDDSHFFPFVRCVADGLVETLVAAGVPKKDVADVRKDVLAVAFEPYLAECQKNDPECTAEEVFEDFEEYLGKTKKKPAKRGA